MLFRLVSVILFSLFFSSSATADKKSLENNQVILENKKEKQASSSSVDSSSIDNQVTQGRAPRSPSMRSLFIRVGTGSTFGPLINSATEGLGEKFRLNNTLPMIEVSVGNNFYFGGVNNNIYVGLELRSNTMLNHSSTGTIELGYTSLAFNIKSGFKFDIKSLLVSTTYAFVGFSQYFGIYGNESFLTIPGMDYGIGTMITFDMVPFGLYFELSFPTYFLGGSADFSTTTSSISISSGESTGFFVLPRIVVGLQLGW